jgi:hypothetical protein
MMWSPDLHVVALLDLYLGPSPEVTELVRRQLLQKEETESIRMAIEGRAKGIGGPETIYSKFLSCSGLDFDGKPAALVSLVATGELQRALFDLTLGHWAKFFQLNRFTEVHNVRDMIESFFTLYSEGTNRAGAQFWWDGIGPKEIPHEPWLTPRLQNDPVFLEVLGDWLSDSEDVQFLMDSYMESSMLVNNPGSPYPVFSYGNGVFILNFLKVRCFGGVLTSLHKR